MSSTSSPISSGSVTSIPSLLSISPSLPPPSAVTTFVTPSTSPSNANSSVIDSGALYLYTFLATLVLLLSVSCAIVMRSIILRRRRSRFMAEALANGTWVARGAYRDPGAKPSLFEAHVADVKHVPAQDELEWDAITPFSATYVNAPPSDTVTQKAAPTSPVSRSPIARVFNVLHIHRPTRPRIQLPLLPISSSQHTPTQNTSITAPTDSIAAGSATGATPSPASTLRIAVLIAMPSPHHLTHHAGPSGDDEMIPQVEFGVAEVGVGPRSGVTNHDNSDGDDR